MKQDERRINVIEDMAGRNGGRNDADVRLAEVAALCELARAVHRLGDLYVTDLVLHGALDDEPPTVQSAATRASQIFLRREYDDARSQSSPGT